MIDNIDVLVYNTKGEIITRGKTLGQGLEVQFKTIRGEKYFLVMQPAKEMQLGKENIIKIKQR